MTLRATFGLLTICFFTFTCKQDLSLDEIKKMELGKQCKSDSLFQGVYFGMTKKQFYEHCFTMNQKKLFFQSDEGVQVKYLISDGFDSPVVFNFFPHFQECDSIRIVSGSFSFQKWAPFQKSFASGELLKRLIIAMQTWYGGNEFVKMPNQPDPFMTEYVKVDCNREVTLKRSLINDEKILVLFEDLCR